MLCLLRAKSINIGIEWSESDSEPYLFIFEAAASYIYDFHIVCEAFMQARHSAAHLSTEHFTHAKVKAIFTMGDFFELLSTFGFPEDALESLMKIEQYVDNDNDNVPQKIIL